MPSDVPKYPHSSLWPTRKEYLWLLRMEASHRGLLFTSKAMECLPTAFTCEDTYDWHGGHLMQDQWLDIGACTEHKTLSGILATKETDYATAVDSTERQALLKCYAWLHLKEIRRNIDEKLLEAGATRSQEHGAEDAVLALLHDLGVLWSTTAAKVHDGEERQACIGIFSDIPQQETTIKYINVPLDLTFAQFKRQVTAEGVVRFLTTKHHPALAKTLFVDDATVYHHPHPTAIDESDPSFPAEIYPVKRDYEAKDNDWHAHVIPLEPAGMLQQPRDWRPINTEADWQSLLRLFKRSPRKVFMRHKSVEDRMDFIKQHKKREALEVAKTGGFYTNLFLERHMEGIYPSDQLQGIRCLEVPGRDCS